MNAADWFIFGALFGALALGIGVCVYLYTRGDDDAEMHGGEGAPAPRVFRQRYECTCGFHGTRELVGPRLSIKCPRCNGVAVARGDAELVT